MEFKQEPLYADREKFNPTRWESIDGNYSIVKYRFKQDKTGRAYQCEHPYWVGYRKSDGNRLTDDMPSFKECNDLMTKIIGEE